MYWLTSDALPLLCPTHYLLKYALFYLNLDQSPGAEWGSPHRPAAPVDEINDREEDHPERTEDYHHQAKRASLTNSSSSSNMNHQPIKHQGRSRSMEFDVYFSDQDGRVLRADSRSASIDVSTI